MSFLVIRELKEGSSFKIKYRKLIGASLLLYLNNHTLILRYFHRFLILNFNNKSFYFIFTLINTNSLLKRRNFPILKLSKPHSVLVHVVLLVVDGRLFLDAHFGLYSDCPSTSTDRDVTALREVRASDLFVRKLRVLVAFAVLGFALFLVTFIV